MKKIKSIFSIIKKSEKPFLSFLEVLWTLLQIPVIIIHEGSHFLFIFITGCKFEINFSKWQFISPITVILDEGELKIKINRYNFPIILNGRNMIKKMIVALAPIFGIIVYLFLTFYLPFTIENNSIVFIIMIYYFLFNYHLFWLSLDDRKCFKESYHKHKLIKEAKKSRIKNTHRMDRLILKI
jgi:hypothetical protein